MRFGIEIEFLGLTDDTYDAAKDLRRKDLLVSADERDEDDNWEMHSDSSVCEEGDMPECYCDWECRGHRCNCRVGIFQTSLIHHSDCEGDKITCEDCGWEEKCDCELSCNCEPEMIGGVELVSKPFNYEEESFEEIRKAFKALEDLGCYTNNSCGFHVHVDAGPANKLFRSKLPEFFNHLIKKYAKMEDELDARVHANRRGNSNGYCRTMKDMNYDKCIGNRYTKLNIHAFMRHGTVEFRHHHGTVDADEAIAWIEFCHKFVEDGIYEFSAMMAETENFAIAS